MGNPICLFIPTSKVPSTEDELSKLLLSVRSPFKLSVPGPILSDHRIGCEYMRGNLDPPGEIR